MPSLTRLRELHVELCRRSMTQVCEDWNMQIGLELELFEAEGALVHNIAEWRPQWNAARNILMTTRIDGGCTGPFYLVFAEHLAFELVRAVMCLPPDAEPDPEGLSDGNLEVFQEMMNLLCGSYNAMFGKLNRRMRVSQSVDDLRVTSLAIDAELHGDLEHIDRGLAVSCKIRLGDREFECLQLMPIPLARAIAQHMMIDPA